MTKPTSDKTKTTDVALVQGPTDDGKGARILRYRDGTLSAGEVRPAEEGKPLAGDSELVKLTPRSDDPAFCDVEVLHKSPTTVTPEQRKQGHGPARVSSDVYRKNWNQVFARRGEKVPREDEEARPAQKRKADYSLN